MVSSFFADIFKNNALNNGLLPVQVSSDFLSEIFQTVENNPMSEFKVDLMGQQFTILESGRSIQFEINTYKRECLLNCYDDIDFLLSLETKIQAFEK